MSDLLAIHTAIMWRAMYCCNFARFLSLGFARNVSISFVMCAISGCFVSTRDRLHHSRIGVKSFLAMTNKRTALARK